MFSLVDFIFVAAVVVSLVCAVSAGILAVRTTRQGRRLRRKYREWAKAQDDLNRALNLEARPTAMMK